MITPTIGRVVWFWQNTKQVQPYAAMIAFVHSDRLVNLGYLNESGAPAGAMRIPLVQEGDAAVRAPYCCWMPYQVGQAAKTEQLEAQLRETRDGS